jgi:hypothetical protein
MRKTHSGTIISQYAFIVGYTDSKFGMYIYQQGSKNISFSVVDYTKDFLWSVSWDGSVFTAYIDMEEIGSYAYDSNLKSAGGDLVIGGRGADGFGKGNVAMCGITVGASVSELHEWYRKYHKTGNL